MQRVEVDVLDEGDVVRWVPVQAVPQLGEGHTVHQDVNRADHLHGQDDQDVQEELFTENGAI